MGLTSEQIENNKNTFLNILSQVNIEGADMQGLIDFLCNKSDFFTAPASTLYHANYTGGLCQHSLNVYYSLCNLVDIYKNRIPEYSEYSLIIVGLLHDISKTNFYEATTINKKIYNEKGTKHDNIGNFDWFAQEAFKVKDASERFLAGSHEVNSMLILSQYLPLTMEEMIAILNHHANTNNGNTLIDQSAIFSKYPLATLLHSADMLSTFILENK